MNKNPDNINQYLSSLRCFASLKEILQNHEENILIFAVEVAVDKTQKTREFLPETTRKNLRSVFGLAASPNAGVPQGTKLGPILFLIMINASIPTPETNLWKFVDDVSVSECFTKNGGASIQSTLDTVSSWASMNLMKLNAKKCKELRVCFFKATPQLPPESMDKYSKQFIRRRF